MPATTTTRGTRKTTTEPTVIEPAVAEPAVTEPAAPVPAVPVSAVPVSAVPVSPAPTGAADRMKVVMVAGVLDEHADGVSAATVVEQSGLRAGIVARVLAAMEIVGAAVRKPADTDDAPELWQRGEADLTTVDLNRATEPEVCPTCHRRMPRRATVDVRRAPASPGHNGDGQPTLGKNGLRDLVAAFLADHPGHEFTPLTIAKELGRSSGAVGNALARLTATGAAVLVKDAPLTYSAAPASAEA